MRSIPSFGVGGALLVALAAGCGDDGSGTGESGGDASTGDATGMDSTGAPLGCDALPALSECDGGVCLGGGCVALTPCAGGACAGPNFDLPDTNLRTCHGPSPDGMDGTIDCPGVPGDGACGGTPYCGQDAQYGWDPGHVASARFAVEGGDEAVVTDSITGLAWQGCTLGQTGAGCAGTATRMTWFDAAAQCEASTWGGHDDWVLPSAYALQSITDYGTTSPAIDRGAFPNAPSEFEADYDQWWIECLWSSSDYADDANVAWAVMVNSGDVSEGSGIDYHLHDKGAVDWEGCYARCVRQPPPPPAARFARVEPVAGEPIVGDAVSGLVWQGCSLGQSGSDCGTPADASMVDWASALAACQDLVYGGHDDWRLPDIKELRSIVDDSVRSPAIDPTMFPSTPFYGVGMTTDNIGQYWSSTSRNYNDFALYVDFGSGFSHFYVQSETRHVRCVRGE